MLKITITERKRKFAREVGSIVLGVLIALGLGAIANEIGWANEVRGARVAIKQEISNTLTGARRRAQLSDCVDRRLDLLTDILAQASRTRQLPALGAIHSPGARNWRTGVWSSYVAADTAAHFPSGELRGLTGVYAVIDTLNEVNDSEDEAWRKLAMFVGPGRPLDAQTEGTLYEALGTARQRNRLMRNSHVWLGEQLARGDLPKNYAAADPKLAPGRGFSTAICDPVGPPPTRYGQAVNLGATPR